METSNMKKHPEEKEEKVEKVNGNAAPAPGTSDPKDVMARLAKMETVLEALKEDNEKKDAQLKQQEKTIGKLKTVVDRAQERLELSKPGKGPSRTPSKYKEFTLPVYNPGGKVIGKQRYALKAATIRNNKIYNPLSKPNAYPFSTVDEVVEAAQAGDTSILKAIIESVTSGNLSDFSRAPFAPVGDLITEKKDSK